MGLFKPKFKKVEPHNIATMQEDLPTAPKVIEPKMPTPMAIAEISKAVMDNVQQSYYQPQIQPIENTKPIQQPFEDKLKKKLEELKVKRMVYDGVIEILEGI